VARSAAPVTRPLSVEPGEGRVLGWSALVLFAVSWASISVANVADTLFLKRIGVDRLPWVFLGNSVLLTFTTFAVGRLAVRWESRTLLVATLAGLGLALVPLWLLVAADVGSAFVLLVLAAKQLDAIALVVFWTAVGSLVSARQGKRLFAPISAGGTFGAVAGSFASGWLGRTFGIATLLPLAGITMALAAAAAAPLLRLRRPRYYRPAPVHALADVAGRRFGPLWRTSALFRVLALTSLLAGILGPMLYFELAYVADRATSGHGGEQRLLDLYALFRGWLNVGVMVIQVTGTSAVFRRLGVPLAAALSPVIYLLGLVGLSVRLSLAAGIAAVAGANLQDHAVYDPAQRILVTLFPERVRAAVTTLIDGPVKRAGGLIGNVVIIIALAVGTPAWVGYAGLPIAAAWLAAALVLWRLYPALLLQVATARRSDFEEPPPLTELLDGGTVRLLEQSLGGSDLERCRAACDVVVEAAPRRAVRALARALGAAPAAHRPLLVAALQRVLGEDSAAALVHDESARLLAALLAAPAGLGALDRAHLVQAYGRLLGAAAAQSPALRTALADPHPAVALAAQAALARAGAAANTALDAALSAAFAHPDADVRRIAGEELGIELRRPAADGAAWAVRLEQLLARLEAPADRAHAAATLAAAAAVHGARLRPHAARILVHRRDDDPAVRIAVLDVIGRARLLEAAESLVDHLTAADPREAAAACAALRALGADAVDVLLHTLRCGRFRAREAVRSILVGLPIDPERLRVLLDREVEVMRRLILRTEALRVGGVADAVLQRLHEQLDESSHTAVVLIATAQDDERLARIGRLLGRTHGTRDRALVLEALEALLPQRERERLLPLLDDANPGARARRAMEALGRPLPTFAEAVAEVLASGDGLGRDLLRGTLPAPTLADLGGDVTYERPDQRMTHVDMILALRRLDLFAGLTTRQLSELARVVAECRVAAGETIVREGEPATQMYFIVAGAVRVTREGAAVSALGPGEFFGEIAVLDGEQRSASVTADGPVHLLRLDRHDLFEVMEEHPAIAVAICQTLGRRIRELLDERADAAAAPGSPQSRF
jgi:AAA family ATP:ADP antiporter